jgi:hypothetical protein
MKTKTLFLILFAGASLGFSNVSYAQFHNESHSSGGGSGSSGDDAFGQGVNIINAGIGFGGGLSSYSYLGGWSTSASPGYMLSFEHGLNDHWGLGLAFTYATSSLTSPTETDYSPTTGLPFTYTEGWKFTAIGIVVRGVYHFATSSKFDPYVGIGLGYFDFSSKYTNNDPNASTAYAVTAPSLGGVAFSGFLGARYYFSSSIGVWAELGYTGYAGNLLNLGLNFKF